MMISVQQLVDSLSSSTGGRLAFTFVEDRDGQSIWARLGSSAAWSSRT